MSTKLTAVITTIQSPTDAVVRLCDKLRSIGSALIVVGDRKGPAAFELDGTEFFDLKRQLASRFDIARRGPVGHYTRKNVGYLAAIAGGADCIYETDDDNAPLPTWSPREAQTLASDVEARGWVNAYRCFTAERIWPRGLPLTEIVPSMATPVALASAPSLARSAIQQGLADGSPDVDAIWRLTLDAPFTFETAPSVRLPPGAWCPFNSQSTWWWPEAFPLLYLPSHCSFRMTDIWRSFVAQRCLWALGQGVVFHAAEVFQDRNAHDLMRDFNDEVPGYQNNERIRGLLDELSLDSDPASVGANLQRCYRTLVAAQLFAPDELALVDTWLDDIERAKAGG
jgi:hypothetical protein